MTSVFPRIFQVAHGDGPIIVLGPHNGRDVPDDLHDEAGKPLGVDAKWFASRHPERRHETCDLGMEELFAELAPKLDDMGCTVIAATMSRLVADLNRTHDHCITTHFDELGEAIPTNITADPEELVTRKRLYYAPWFNAVAALIDKAEKRHGYAVILDLHSFTPHMHGQERALNMGSISPAQTSFSDRFDTIAATSCLRHNLTFQVDAPYSTRTFEGAKEIFAYGALRDHFVGAYHGIEMRNDYAQDPQGRAVLKQVLVESIEELLNQQDLALIAQPA